MKRVIIPGLMLALALTACGDQYINASTASPVEAPAPVQTAAAPASDPGLSIPLTGQRTEPVPCEYSISALPTQFADSAMLEANAGAYLLAQLPDEDVSLYGLIGEQDLILLRQGDTLTAYPLSWYTPRRLLPQLFSGDYDGDGETELLLLTYFGSGTGVSTWNLTVFEQSGDGWDALTLPDRSYDNDLTPLLSCVRDDFPDRALLSLGDACVTLSLPEHITADQTLEPYSGTIVHYEVSEDRVTARLSLGLAWDGHGYTLFYPADLEAALQYDGKGFTLSGPSLIADPE